MGHHRRNLNQALNSSKTFSEVDQLQVFNELFNIQSSLKLEGDHCPKAPHLFSSNSMPREIGQSGIVNLGNMCICLEKINHRGSILLMDPHPGRQCLDPPLD